MVKRVPKKVLPVFAKVWSDLLGEAVRSGSVSAWKGFLVFPRAILLSPPRGGRRISQKTSLADLIQSRLEAWPARAEELWQEVLSRSGRREVRQAPAKEPTDVSRSKALEMSVVRALRLGDVQKALRVLCSAEMAPKGASTLSSLKALHPPGPLPLAVPPSVAPRFSADTVKTALSSFGPGSAAGLFGYTPFLLQQCLRAESFHFSRALTDVVNLLADGRAPLFLQPFLAGGVSIALAKPNQGVRPLCCGDPLRRLVAKCFCMAGKDEISAVFKGRNYGVGCPGGVEVVAHSLRDVLQRHAQSDLALLKIDFKNAFNLVDRQSFMSTTCSTLPALSNWTNWCYSSPSILLYNHSDVFSSSSGVQQGDPLGPLYFCFGLSSLVEEISRLCPVYQKWYMDDGGIVAPVDVLLKVWDILRSTSTLPSASGLGSTRPPPLLAPSPPSPSSLLPRSACSACP